MLNIYFGAGAVLALIIAAGFYNQLMQMGVALAGALHAFATEYNDAYKANEETDEDTSDAVVSANAKKER
jgi:hypothetical protein